MSLTANDLRAIKQLIDNSIDERVPRIIDERVPKIIEGQVPGIVDGRVQPMLDKLEDRMCARLTRLEVRLTERIDEVDDRLARQTADGFAEVHARLDGVYAEVNGINVRLGRLERVRRSEPGHAKLKA